MRSKRRLVRTASGRCHDGRHGCAGEVTLGAWNSASAYLEEVAAARYAEALRIATASLK